MRKITISAIVAFITYSLSSCIFEDRSVCPAYLHLNFLAVPSETEDIFLIIRYKDGTQLRDTVPIEEFDNHVIPVRRGRFCLSAFGNIDRMVYDDGYIVPVGYQADSIYADFINIICDDDAVQATVSLQRAYTRLHLRVIGYNTGYDSLYVSVNSEAVGYDLYGNIKAGEYKYQPDAVRTPDSSADYYEFSSRIIRYSEYVSLDLYVIQEDEHVWVGNIDISKMLSAHEELQNSDDLFVLVDFSKSSIYLSSTDWNCITGVVIEI